MRHNCVCIFNVQYSSILHLNTVNGKQKAFRGHPQCNPIHSQQASLFLLHTFDGFVLYTINHIFYVEGFFSQDKATPIKIPGCSKTTEACGLVYPCLSLRGALNPDL